MAIGSKLRGEKRVEPKPLLVAPAIMCLCEVIAQGHIQEAANGGGASARDLTIQQCEGRGCEYHRTYTKSRKDLCSITSETIKVSERRFGSQNRRSLAMRSRSPKEGRGNASKGFAQVLDFVIRSTDNQVKKLNQQ